MADNGNKIRATAYDGLKRVYSKEATLIVVVAPEAIGGIKGKAVGAQVKLKNPVVVTQSNTSEYWVQEQDRSAGIRVVSSQNPPVNTLVSGVEGVLKVDAATTEVYIRGRRSGVHAGPARGHEPLGWRLEHPGSSRSRKRRPACESVGQGDGG